LKSEIPINEAVRKPENAAPQNNNEDDAIDKEKIKELLKDDTNNQDTPLNQVVIKEKQMTEEAKATFPIDNKGAVIRINSSVKKAAEKTKPISDNQNYPQKQAADAEAPIQSKKSQGDEMFTLGQAKSPSNDQLASKQIMQEIVEKGKKLQIQVKDGGKIPKGTLFDLDASGYKNSKRKERDGVIYFGCLSKSQADTGNDIEFSVEDSGFGSRQFKITYSIDDDEYFIKDLCEGAGTFVRIDNKTV
jgi:hypothetical protein